MAAATGCGCCCPSSRGPTSAAALVHRDRPQAGSAPVRGVGGALRVARHELRAKRIGAVNTIVRSPDRQLAGANTDGVGFIETLLTPAPGEGVPLLHSLDGIDALVLGAGGSARAVAFALAERIGEGKLLIANRTFENARVLPQEIGQYHPNTLPIGEEKITTSAPHAKLIVYCTTKGQKGIERHGAGAASPGARLERR